MQSSNSIPYFFLKHQARAHRMWRASDLLKYKMDRHSIEKLPSIGSIFHNLVESFLRATFELLPQKPKPENIN